MKPPWKMTGMEIDALAARNEERVIRYADLFVVWVHRHALGHQVDEKVEYMAETHTHRKYYRCLECDRRMGWVE